MVWCGVLPNYKWPAELVCAKQHNTPQHNAKGRFGATPIICLVLDDEYGAQMRTVAEEVKARHAEVTELYVLWGACAAMSVPTARAQFQ